MCEKLPNTAYKGKRLPQYKAALSVCIGSLAAGAVIGWTGNITEDMKSLSYNGLTIDDNSLGWIGSLVTLGMMVSCIPIGKLCDMIGRKAAMLSVTALFVIGWLLILYANCLAMLYIGRFVTGMAVGAFFVAAPIYTTEIAQKEVRGALGTYLELFMTSGTLVAFFTPMIVDMKTHTYIMSALPLVFALVFAFQPESPLYHINKKHEKEARIALISLRGKKFDIDSELTCMQEVSKTSIMNIIKKRSTKKALIASFALMFFQGMTGIYAVLFYTDTIFKSSGSTFNTKTATIIIGALEVVGTLISSLLADRISRRVLLMYSTFFVSVSLAILAVFLTLVERQLISQNVISSLEYLPLLCLSIYILMFSIAIGPIAWVVSAELFPAEIKGTAMGTAAMFNSLISFITAKVFFDIKHMFGEDINYYMYSIVTLTGTIFIYFYLPETKGKTFEEIQKELDK